MQKDLFSFVRGSRAGACLLAAALAAGWAGAATAAGSTGAGLGAAAAAAEPEPLVYHATMPVRGRTMGAEEPIVFAGLATVDARLIRAPGAPPIAEVSMDFSGVSARGEESGELYHVDPPTRLQRRLAEAQVVDITFPYYRQDDPLSARSTTASFQMAASGKPGKQLAIGYIPDDDKPAGKE